MHATNSGPLLLPLVLACPRRRAKRSQVDYNTDESGDFVMANAGRFEQLRAEHEPTAVEADPRQGCAPLPSVPAPPPQPSAAEEAAPLDLTGVDIPLAASSARAVLAVLVQHAPLRELPAAAQRAAALGAQEPAAGPLVSDAARELPSACRSAHECAPTAQKAVERRRRVQPVLLTPSVRSRPAGSPVAAETPPGSLPQQQPGGKKGRRRAKRQRATVNTFVGAFLGEGERGSGADQRFIRVEDSRGDRSALASNPRLCRGV